MFGSGGATLLLSERVAFQLRVDQATASDRQIVLGRESNIANRQRKSGQIECLAEQVGEASDA